MKQVITAPKTGMFRIRVNPDVRRQLEAIYEQNGLTLTDAVNVFFQQSLRAGGFPFPVTTEKTQSSSVKKLSRSLSESCSAVHPAPLLVKNRLPFRRSIHEHLL